VNITEDSTDEQVFL